MIVRSFDRMVFNVLCGWMVSCCVFVFASGPAMQIRWFREATGITEALVTGALAAVVVLVFPLMLEKLEAPFRTRDSEDRRAWIGRVVGLVLGLITGTAMADWLGPF